MAKNKKPRKHYHPKPVRSLCIVKEDIDALQSMATDISLAAETSLPAGTATVTQVDCIKAMLNHAMTGIMSRKYLSPTECANALAILDKGGDALVAMVKKACDRRDKEGTEGIRFICTGDELNAIRDAVAVADQFLRDSYDVEPSRTMREFFAMKTLLTRGITNPTTEQVNSVVGELSKIESWEWRKLK